ncbi:MAG: hypothetical protein P4L40_03525 [Terracidiphilus sp.]|nr:hypothetical protein [Terracidiphilus sp.]
MCVYLFPQAEMDALFVRLFAYSADLVQRVEGVYAERVKALEAQADELAVTSAQLRAAAEVAAQALALPPTSAFVRVSYYAFVLLSVCCCEFLCAGRALGMARACASVCAVSGMVGECPAPAATAILRIAFQPAPLLTALDALAELVTDNARDIAAQVSVIVVCALCFAGGMSSCLAR